MTFECANPYPGPESFARGDARPYFGRDQETSDLISLAVTERLLVFYAPSGAGKTSLLNKRVIPSLEEKLYEVLPTARVSGAASLPAGVQNVYAYNLMMRLAPSEPQPERFAGLSLSDFLWHLSTEDGQRYHYDASDQALRKATPKRDLWPRVLILDQFEEIVTAYPTYWRHREDFFRQLDEALSSDAMLRVIMSLRSDYVQDLERYAGLLQHGLRARYQMFLMGTQDAHLAIEGPAAACGRTFEPGVAQQLVRNMSQVREADVDGKMRIVPGEAVEPIQLQVVCYQLWESMKNEPGDKIEMKDLRRLARAALAARVDSDQLTQREQYELLTAFVDGALGAFYETALERSRTSASAYVDEAFLRNWLSTQLITESGTRGFMQRGQDDTGGVPDEVVQKLVDNHLVRSDMRGSVRLVELIHDRFVEPIRQSNKRYDQQRIAEFPWIADARRWYESGDSEATRTGPLPQGAAFARIMHEAEGRTFEPAVDAYLEAARHEEQERRERSNRLRITVTSAVAVAFLGVMLFAILGWINSNGLNQQLKLNTERMAAQAAVVSQQNEQLIRQGIALSDETKRANANEHAAQSALRANRSLMLADQARRAGNLEDSLLLARAAVSISSTLPAEGALLDALDEAYRSTAGGFVATQSMAPPQEPVQQAMSPDGVWLAAAGSSRRVYLGDSVEATWPISFTVGLDITALAVSNDGEWVVIAGCLPQDSPSGPQPPPTEPSKPDSTGPLAPVFEVGASTAVESGESAESANSTSEAPTEPRLANCSLEIWTVAAKAPVTRAMTLPLSLPALAITISPNDPDALAVGLDSGVVQRLDLPSRQFQTLEGERIPELIDLAFDDAGQLLAALGRRGLVNVWNWPSGQPIPEYQAEAGEVSGYDQSTRFDQIAFVLGGWLAITANQPEEIGLWTLKTGQPVARLTLSNGAAQDLTFDPSRQALVALQPGRLSRWTMNKTQWLDLACTRAGRNLTFFEWQKAFPGETDYETSRICRNYDYPLDVSFAQAKIDEAKRSINDCTPQQWDAGMKLLQEARDLQVDPPYVEPLDTALAVVSDQALVYLRRQSPNYDDEARKCLRLAAEHLPEAGRPAIDVARAEAVGRRQVKIEAALAGSQSPDPAVLMQDQDWLRQNVGQWPSSLPELSLLTSNDRARGQIGAGQNPDYFFLGRKGQEVTVNVAAQGDTLESAGVTLEDFEHNYINSAYGYPENNRIDMKLEGVVLSRDGLYRIRAYADWGAGSFTMTLAMRDLPILEAGAPVRSRSATDGRWRFDGSAGQIVALTLDAGSDRAAPHLMLSQAGGPFYPLREAAGSANAPQARTAPLILPTDDLYLVTVDQVTAAPYTVTLSMLQPRDLALDTPRTSTSAADELWAFAGTAGQVIDITLDSSDAARFQPELALLDAQGGLATDSSREESRARIRSFIVPRTGIYYVNTGPGGSATPYTVTVRAATPPVLVLGSLSREATPNDVTLWSLEGVAGQIVSLQISSTEANAQPVLNLLSSQGELLRSSVTDTNPSVARIPGHVFSRTGPYLVRVEGLDASVPYQLRLDRIEPAALTPDQSIRSTTDGVTFWNLVARPGQVVQLSMDAVDTASLDPLIRLLREDGREIASDDDGGVGYNARLTLVLPDSPGYLVQADRWSGNGEFTLTVAILDPQPLPLDGSSAPILPDRAYQFSGQAGQMIEIDVTDGGDGSVGALQLVTSQGVDLTSSGDSSRLSALLPADGDYLLLPRDVADSGLDTMTARLLDETEALNVPEALAEQCLRGAIAGSAAVLEACNRAVEDETILSGDETALLIHLGRGIVLAQLGDYAAALADLESVYSAAVSQEADAEDLDRIEGWLETLRQNRNPFDNEELEWLEEQL